MAVFVPDGPFRKAGQKLDAGGFLMVFKNRKFRTAAFGYFGHMWELYAFWAFVPLLLNTYLELHPAVAFNSTFWSFLIIAIGGLGCVAGGYLSAVFGEKKIATTALLLSGICCLLSPLLLATELSSLFLGFLLFWGLVVIADSPLFSTLVARNVNPELRGTALTIVNCIGFSITVVSIQLLNQLTAIIDPTYLFLVLALGPTLGLLAQLKRN